MSQSQPTETVAEPPSDGQPAQRKKRRSSASGKAGWVLCGLLAVTASGYIGFRIIVQRYLHGKAFLSKISQAASSALKVKGQFAPLEWNDSRAASSSFRGSGVPGSPVAQLTASDIDASLNLRAIWDGVWELSEVRVTGLDIDLAETSRGDISKPITSSDAHKERDRGFFASLLPRKTRVEKLTVENASIRFPEIPGQPQRPEARRVRLSIRPIGSDYSEGVTITGSQGELRTPSGKRLILLDFEGKWRNHTFFLTDSAADIKGSDGARVECTGEINTSESGAPNLELDVELSGLNISEIVAPDWKQRLSGELDAQVSISGPADESIQSGTVTLSSGTIQTLPLLERLAEYTGHETFRRLPLNRATARFERSGAVTKVSEIVIESTGTLRITGALELEGNRITNGTLQVGVVPGVLRWIPGAEQKVFTNFSDGHLWTTMRVSGPLDALQEDLSGRLVTGAIVQTVEDAPEKILETGTDVIEKGSSLLKKSVRSGLDLIEGFVPLLGN
jgi:hypothetical protein